MSEEKTLRLIRDGTLVGDEWIAVQADGALPAPTGAPTLFPLAKRHY